MVMMVVEATVSLARALVQQAVTVTTNKSILFKKQQIQHLFGGNTNSRNSSGLEMAPAQRKVMATVTTHNDNGASGVSGDGSCDNKPLL